MKEIKSGKFDKQYVKDLNDNFRSQKERVDRLVHDAPQPSEIVDARGKGRVLNDRFIAIENTLDDKVDKEELDNKASKDQLAKVEMETVRKDQLDEVNKRIDRIITEPSKGISQQEIIDARQGEDSLGDNIAKIKEEVKHNIENVVKNGLPIDRSNWSASYGSITYQPGTDEGFLRIQGDGTDKAPRAIQPTNAEFVGGDKIYIATTMRSGSTRIHHMEIGVWNRLQSGGSPTIRRLTAYHPTFWEWIKLDGIIELPADGIGQLSVQFLGDYSNAENASNDFFDAKKIMVINLTKAFGAGNEPSVEDVRSILNAFPGDFLDGKANLVKIEQSNVISKANKDEVNKELEELKRISIDATNQLPVNKNKFDVEAMELFSFDKQSIHTKTSMFQDNERLFNGKPTFKLISYGGEAALTSNITGGTGPVNLSNASYIDFYFYAEDLSKYTNIQIELLETNGGLGFVTYNRVNQVREVNETGFRYIRIPMDQFVPRPGEPSLENISHVRVQIMGNNVALNVAKIDAIIQDRGTVYMYFDDATISHYKTAFPIMQKYRLKGTIGVPTERVGQTVGVSGLRATWGQLREMDENGWLVVSHGLDEKSLAEVPIEEAERQIRESSRMLREQGFYFGSKCIVAPQGSWNDAVDEVAKKYLSLCRTTGYARSGRSDLAMEFPQSHPRKQYYKSPVASTTIEEIKGWIDHVIETKKELAIAWHIIDDEMEWDYANKVWFFEEVCAYIREKIDEGVLRAVTWRDTMLQSGNINPIDAEGDQYLVSNDGKPTILTLPRN